ncbi:MAG: protein translocase subunit SecE [Saprospiraceae bacterium]|nr:MAG: protein translocase subunit SecE [Saprospiraceae bacterium]
MEKIKLYIKESYNELINKVTWPTWSDLQNTTVVVIVASLIMAMIIFGMDAISNLVTDFIYSLSA